MKVQFLPSPVCVGLVALACLAANSNAIIIGGDITVGTGSFMELTAPLSNPHGPPNSVGDNTFQDPNLYGFNEDQNVLIGPGNLTVDVVPGGGSGVISAGMEVASHYIFFDPFGNTSQEGYVDFDAPILALITSTATLAASDYLANTGINYLNPSLRGLESGDFVTIDSALPNRLLVDWTASSPGDYIRVLTAHSPGAVPETGSTLLLLACGVGMILAVRRFPVAG